MPGKARKESFAGKVLAAVNKIGGNVSVDQLVDHFCLQTRGEIKKLHTALSDLTKYKKIRRVERGVYAPADTDNTKPRPINARMWSIIRARRVVTVDDLQELTGASENYAKEYLQMLCRKNVVKKHGDKYRLVNDQGPQTPQNTDRMERLRKLRIEKKKAALDAIERARKAVLDIPD